MIFRWFMSKTVREALTVHKHYRRLLAAQRDLLSPSAIAPVQVKLDELRAAIQEGTERLVKGNRASNPGSRQAGSNDATICSRPAASNSK